MTTPACHAENCRSAKAIGAPVSPFQARIAGLVDLLLSWQERARQRTSLAEMDDRMLADIGLSRADAEREAARPFWT